MSKLLLFLLLLLLIVTVDGQNYFCFDQDGNFMSNETYGNTLDTLLGSITTTTSGTLTYGLFNVSASRPQDPDDIQVLGVCSGDVTSDECRDCLNATAHQVRQLCPTKRQATLFEEKCWIRYSSGQLYSMVKTDPYIKAWNMQNTSDWDQFGAELKKLLNSLRDEAASGGPIRKYATNTRSVDLSTLYGTVQCSPDLSYQQCNDCLMTIIGRLPEGKVGGVVLSPSCRSRFETYRLFDAVAVSRSPPPPPPSALPPSTTTMVSPPPPPPYDLPPLTMTMVSPPPPPPYALPPSTTTMVSPPPPPPYALPPSTTTIVPPPPPPPSALPPATTTIVPPPQLTQSGSNSSKTWIIVSASSGSAVTFVICILIFLIVKWKKRPRERSTNEVIDEDVVTAESLQFDLNIIRDATENFSEANKLGQGGFGSVYKGKLPSGQEIAVKRLSQNSGQGESEFKNEARLLSRLQHRNLVRLLGFCLEGIERLLVYEFVPNSSLDKFIFDPLKRALLDWDTRYKIITGIARGLLYLHVDSRLRIIHRDLKASNVLLDMDMNPKVSDFGTARLFETDQTRADTSRIMGTYGYMAPEYVARGHYSLKSDVFSFGVLVLEIVSGQRNLIHRSREDLEMLISHAWTNWREGNISNIVDPAVSSGYSANILRCIHIGLLCVQENETNRPTMASIVLMLNSHSVTLPVPTQPAFLMNTYTVNDNSSGFDSTSRTAEADRSGKNACTFSINEASITEPYPR